MNSPTEPTPEGAAAPAAERPANVRTELIAGVTTFFTMAYIVVVNPLILSTVGEHRRVEVGLRGEEKLLL